MPYRGYLVKVVNGKWAIYKESTGLFLIYCPSLTFANELIDRLCEGGGE